MWMKQLIRADLGLFRKWELWKSTKIKRCKYIIFLKKNPLDTIEYCVIVTQTTNNSLWEIRGRTYTIINKLLNKRNHRKWWENLRTGLWIQLRTRHNKLHHWHTLHRSSTRTLFLLQNLGRVLRSTCKNIVS